MDGKHIANSVWNGIVGWVRQESAAATALVQAFIALGIAFAWWHWSNAQTGAVFGIVAALLGMFVRSQVTPLVRPRSGRNVPLAEVGPPEPAPPPADRPAAHAAGTQEMPQYPATQQNPAMPQYPPVQQNPTLPQDRPPAGPPGEPPFPPRGR